MLFRLQNTEHMHRAVDLYIVCSVVILPLHLLSSELKITNTASLFTVFYVNQLCSPVDLVFISNGSLFMSLQVVVFGVLFS